MNRLRICLVGLILVLFLSFLPGHPAYAATYTVINTNDSGAGSLRWAITQANAAGADTIEFNIPGAGVHTIQPLTSLPGLIDNDTTIDGYTQPGSAPANGSTAATILIELDGSLAGPTASGLVVISDNNLVRGLAINRFAVDGIVLGGYEGISATNNIIAGNYIGTDATGMIYVGNGLTGVFIGMGADQNVVGGTTPAERNVISCNAEGVAIRGAQTRLNSVRGNYIGVNAYTSFILGNDYWGVHIYDGAHDNTVGGYVAGAGNVISGNKSDGVRIGGPGTDGNVVAGNYIGTDRTGLIDEGNLGSGVYITRGAKLNTVGGDVAAGRNVISGNQENGVTITGTGVLSNTVAGNYIGLGVDGATEVGNAHQGVGIGSGAHYNTIGGDSLGERNVISGNVDNGVALFYDDVMSNTISGNYIGTDAAGTAAVSNTCGIAAYLATGNLIGGTEPGQGNLVSGNRWAGIVLFGSGTTGNTIAGNWVGISAGGDAVLPNGINGIYLRQGAGGNIVGPHNVVSGNTGSGIVLEDAITGTVIVGNWIGIDAAGTAALGNTGEGILLQGASGNTIGGGSLLDRNVISGNGDAGVYLQDAETTGNVISGNYIGTDPSGSLALGNLDGVVLTGSSSGNVVGGTTPGERNVISGNGQDGIVVSASSGNTVSGNYIGLDATGAATLSNAASGVKIDGGSADNVVGGDEAGTFNVISGNGQDGLYLENAANNTIQGNRIGTDAGGATGLGNGRYGLYLGAGAADNTIGGAAPGQGNVVAANEDDGIYLVNWSATGNVIAGNWIGTNSGGTAELGNGGSGVELGFDTTGNTVGPANVIAYNANDGVLVSADTAVDNDITQNSIHGNTALGIELVAGAHGGIAAPAITTVTFGSGTATAAGVACAGCIVELFQSSDGEGEGELYLGSAVADAGGSFSVELSSLLYPYLTATATGADEGTSEFSEVFVAEVEYEVYLPVVVR